jgi:phosphohistidine phosphatase|tara:strand:+ start:14299 stop:14781 length:483 start_codon:yes stop_codon:yes gene_type:complete
MKKVILLRHAKSSWDDFMLKDFERPLSTRGIQDAELMGNYFKSKKITLDTVLLSPSQRTQETFQHFFSSGSIQKKLIESFYHADIDSIINELNVLDENVKNVMIIGHNPSMHELCEYLTGTFIEKYPTCGLAIMNFSDKWAELGSRCTDLEHFKKPSELR